MNSTSRTLLIIDDSSEDRELYRRYLLRDQDYAYTILEASLGQQGLDLWHQHQPDAVLLDYRLPDLDGLEFLAQLQSSLSEQCLPVIMVTGQGNEAIAVQAMKAGAQDYLVKGQITPERLHLAVNGAIETVQLRTQLQQCIERERIVGQITRQIYQTLDFDRILQTTVTEVRQFLQTDRVLVLQSQTDGNGTVVAESVGAAWQSLLSSTTYDSCLVENYLQFSRPESLNFDPAFAEDYVKRYRQGQVTAIPDIHNSDIDPCHIELLAQWQVNAKLVVPILQNDRFWGLLIAHHCKAPRFWEPLEIDLLQELAIQLGIALHQAELYQQAQTELAERHRVEVELRESEEQLRSALEASRMGTWDWNIATGQIQWSSNLEAMFGLEAGAFDGSFQMFSERLHPDDRDRVLAAVEQAIATREDYEIEFRVIYPNGTVRWALSQGKVFYDQNGHPVRMAGNDIDITDRKQAETALQESESRFRQMAENIDVVFWMREVTENRVSYVSPAYARLWGLNPQELHENQQAWVDYIHPDDRASVDRAFQAKAAAGLFDEEYRIILPNGQTRWVHDRCFPLRDEVGALYRFAGIAEDITDRKRSEQALREGEERFRASVENMLDCFAIYEAIRNEQGEIVDFRTEYINDAACLNNQMTREQQIGRGLCELLPGHRDSGLFDEYCQVVETGQSLVKDSLVYEDDYGQQRLTRAFDIRIAKFGDGYVATWRNITERKQIEEALRENEQLLRLALTGAQAGSWDWEIATSKIAWSPENYTLYGIAPANGSPKYEDWHDTVHPDDREFTNAEVLRIIEEKLPEFRAEFRIIHPQRGIRWLLGLGQLSLNEQGEAIRLSGINLDITDRKQSEAELLESEQQLRIAKDAAALGIYDYDITSGAIQWDARVRELWGVVSDEPITYEVFASGLHPEDRAATQAAVDRALDPTGDGTYYAEYRVIHRTDGMTRWIAATGIVFFEHERAVRLVGTVQDITAHKQFAMERDRLLKQEQAARAEAERANRIKDEFLAVLSHELRSPLNPILGWATLLQSRKFDATITNEALATIERNARLQTQLIDDLLDVAKILRGKLSMNVAPVDLTFVIEQAIDTVRTAAVAKDITLHAVLPQMGRVLGDSARLQQIVWNLLSNAIKFSPAKGQVEVRLEREGNQAKIIVSDTGRGINPNFLPHIFESFRQEDASTTRQYGGLGLGLAIVRHLVEDHGGTINADSPGEGQGATFTVQLPLLDAESEQPPAKAVSSDELDLTGVRILAVDDEPDARELLTALLTQYGAEVLTVTAAAEVLTHLASFQPDVLISDIGMPEIDGYMLIQQIRALPPEKGGQTSAIALTAYARGEDYQQAINSGYQRHLTKPLDLDQLVHVVVELTRHTTVASRELAGIDSLDLGAY
ncbi:MAG: PAS domain-containing protein [Stenomitos frigidus ULC029]